MTEHRLDRRRELLHAAGLPPTLRAKPSRSVNATAPAPVERAPKLAGCLALIATRNFLPFAKLTARSFLEHHPEFRAFLLLVDGEPDDAALFSEGEVVCLPDLGLHRAEWYGAKFNAAEFSNSLKPTFLRHLAAFAETAVYLDCDTAVFSRLSELLELIETSDLVLIPHMLAPFPRPEQFWTHPTRADVFNSGLVNAGCFGIRLEPCRAFLTWWEAANLAPGAFYEGAGYQTDQQHLNWALITLPGARVLRSSRYNVAYWNLHDRDFRVERDEHEAACFEVDREPLGFFHFSGYDVNEKLRLSRHDGRHSVYNLPAVAKILDWYSDQVLACPTAGLLNETYSFDHLSNGFLLTRFVRELLKKYEAYVPILDLADPAGADALCGFLMEPLPPTGSILPLVAAEIYESRPDLRQAFPGAHSMSSPSGYWRWFCRHAGGECNIQMLVDSFRRSLISDSICGFAEEVAAALGAANLRFLGCDRMEAAQRLTEIGSSAMGDTLLEARTEWPLFTDVSAALEIYAQRPDLQKAFPDILDRDHAGFCEWLTNHGFAEHGCAPDVGENFRRRPADVVLARIFSFVSRNEDAIQVFPSLLSDAPDPGLRELIRGAGEGLEYDLDDVVVLRLIHQTRRHLLVPLYLELPAVRRQANASRTAGANNAALPESVRHTEWATRGCELHAASFKRFEACLDDEMRRWAAAFSSPSRDVLGFLRGPGRDDRPTRMVEPAYRAAVRRLKPGEGAPHDLWSRLKERSLHPGVNIFGYFESDIGVGESTRGLAQAVSLLRPVNRIPLCTSQLREGTELTELFQRFDYLSDTNVFVSYPHQREDLLGMMRPEHLAGRRNVAHLAWEQKDANPLWRVVYDRYDEIWVISEFAATGFRRMFPDRVRVVPNVLDFAQFPLCAEAARTRLKGGTLNFLFAFDANSSMERKNPDGVIDAFVSAFSGTRFARHARLTLKISGMHRPEHAIRVEQLMRKAKGTGMTIHFDGRPLARDAMLRLIAESDCYVSLHRAEGFGYTMAEAMFYGIPVIASGYSGNLEYMTPENSFLVPCAEAFVKSADGPFQRGSTWGEPDIEAAAALIWHVAEQPSNAIAVGQRGRESVLSKLSAAAVARAIQPHFVTPRRVPSKDNAAD